MPSSWTHRRKALLDWYDAHARDLPWRRTRDPYAVWVSEVMLQQTRVDTVIPYYHRFLERFPTPRALADAPEDAVLGAWSGLGYYRRARLLQAGAREVVARHGGRVPRDAAARRALPGVGRYTAGAIGSIAFELPEPLVDGNVARVLARLEGIDTPLGRADTERALWAAAAAIVPGERPGALNQALMELGATVCTRASPRCGACPVRDRCVARRDGLTRELPVPRPRRPPRRVALVAAVAHDPDGRPWLARSGDGLFAGLWAPPVVEAPDGAPAAHRALDALGLAFAAPPVAVGRVEHVLTHRRLDVAVWAGPAAPASPRDDVAPRAAGDLAAVGVSRFARKLLAAAGHDDPTAGARRQLRLPHGR